MTDPDRFYPGRSLVRDGFPPSPVGWRGARWSALPLIGIGAGGRLGSVPIGVDR